MKVAMVSYYPVEPGKITGGVEAATNYLVEGFQRAAFPDLDLHVLAFLPRLGADRVEKRDGATIYLLDSPSTGGYSNGFSRDRRKFRQYMEPVKPDLVHAQGAGRFGYIALRSGYPFVLTVHGIGPLNAKYDFQKKLKDQLRGALLNYYYYQSLKKAQWVISISPYVGEMVRRHVRAEMIPIENALSEAYYDLPDREEPGRLLCCAHMYPGKGIVDLVEAMRILRQRKTGVTLRIAGGRHDADYSRLVEALVDRYQLGDRVEFLGLLNDEQIRDEYSRCAAVVLPSYQETSPMVIQQAMAAGKPSIATDVGGVKSLLREGKAGVIVPPRDAGKLAAAIEMVVTDPEARRRMADAALREAQSFRSAEVAAKTYEVYRKACGG